MNPRTTARLALQSFWMGGFEGADHINCHGAALDMNALSGHVELLDEDHRRVAALGLGGVRESAGWRICAAAARPGMRYDFERLQRVATTAERQGIQVLWTLMHYGIPDDLQLTAHDFVDRFAEFAALAAREIRRIRGAPSIYTPINEIGFLSWAYTQRFLIGGRRGGDAQPLDGFDVKCRLVEASLAGIAAIRRDDPGAQFLQVEPLIHVAAADDHPHLAADAATFSGYQWQAWDMLLGRLKPELGGHASAIDLIGVNHYHDSQWQLPSGAPLAWNPPHPSRREFAHLLELTWRRYHRPIVVAETSHTGAHRPAWLDSICTQTLQALRLGVPVEGICLYPVTDRPDWNNAQHWHRCGLWDCGDGDAARMERAPAAEYLAVLQRHQLELPPRVPTQISAGAPATLRGAELSNAAIADELAGTLIPEAQRQRSQAR